MDFVKYQGTGNDFILVDARNTAIPDLDVRALCDRRFGIGADGLMFLKEHAGYDFEMVYYNSDGNLSSMCGNGGRCIAKFAHSLGIGKGNKLQFLAVDGPHDAVINGNQVELGMKDVEFWETRTENVFVLNTGSPHYVVFTHSDPSETNLLPFARTIRYNEEFKENGINVNLVQIIGENSLKMRTYERGVEDETYSCGTGVTAAAIAYQIKTGKDVSEISVTTPGGELRVLSRHLNSIFDQVILCGPATFVFRGTI